MMIAVNGTKTKKVTPFDSNVYTLKNNQQQYYKEEKWKEQS